MVWIQDGLTDNSLAWLRGRTWPLVWTLALDFFCICELPSTLLDRTGDFGTISDFEVLSPCQCCVQQILHPTTDTGSLSASRQNLASTQTEMIPVIVPFFLSVYVDDITMVGGKESAASMWEKLRMKIAFEERTMNRSSFLMIHSQRATIDAQPSAGRVCCGNENVWTYFLFKVGNVETSIEKPNYSIMSTMLRWSVARIG